MWFGTIWHYGHSKKNFFTVFQSIFYGKTKWNIAYEYLKIEIFSRDTNILSHKHWTPNIFGAWATTIGIVKLLGVLGSLSYPIPNFKKMVCPKNLLMGPCVNDYGSSLKNPTFKQGVTKNQYRWGRLPQKGDLDS